VKACESTVDNFRAKVTHRRYTGGEQLIPCFVLPESDRKMLVLKSKFSFARYSQALLLQQSDFLKKER
jgi:hypothetical protein